MTKDYLERKYQLPLEQITNLLIPGGAEMVDGGTCFGLNKLETLKVERGVWFLGSRSFSKCVNLREVTLPDTLRHISEYAFAGCETLEHVVLPDSVESLGTGVFRQCSGLKSIRLSERLLRLPEDVFAQCTGIRELTLPKYLRFVERAALPPMLERVEVDCESEFFTSVDGVLFTKDMKTLIFYPPTRKAKTYTIPEGVEMLKWKCFNGVDALEELTLPSTLKDVENMAIFQCPKLKRVVNRSGRPLLKKLFMYADDALCLHSGFMPGEELTQLGFMFKAMAVACYLSETAQYSKKEQEAYFKYARSQAKRLLFFYASERARPPIEKMVEMKLVRSEMIVELIEKYHGDIDFVTWLMDLQYRRFNMDEERERREMHMFRSLMTMPRDVLPASELRKIWSCEERPDGGLTVYNYWGDDMSPVVPEKIGMRPVVEVHSRVLYVDRITIPPSVHTIRMVEKELDRKLLAACICGAPGSVAEAFALEHEIPFEAVLPAVSPTDRVKLPPPSPDLMRKTWRFTRNMYDEITMMTYLGKEQEVIVPARIGKGTVTAIKLQGQACRRVYRLVLPDTLRVLGSHCFHWSLREIVIPPGVTEIAPDALGDAPSNIVIYGEPGSCAETYAAACNLTFQPM